MQQYCSPFLSRHPPPPSKEIKKHHCGPAKNILKTCASAKKGSAHDESQATCTTFSFDAILQSTDRPTDRPICNRPTDQCYSWLAPTFDYAHPPKLSGIAIFPFSNDHENTRDRRYVIRTRHPPETRETSACCATNAEINDYLKIPY